MSELDMLVILGILDLQLRTVLVIGLFVAVYNFYKLLKAYLPTITEELRRLE